MEVMEAKALGSLITTTLKAIEGNYDKLHECLIQSMLHARPQDQGGFGDTRPLGRIIAGLTKGTRVEAIVFWVHEHSPIQIGEQDGKKYVKGVIKPTAKTYREWRVEEAQATPFWLFSKEKKPGKLSLEKMIATIKGLVKKAEEAAGDPDKYEGDIKAIETFAARLEGLVASAPAPKAARLAQEQEEKAA